MQRLGIFIFYDANGIVDRYVEILLESLMPELNKLVIIVNGNVTDDSKRKLGQYTKNIFLRENVGFDGGAYKDAFMFFLAEENWGDWDEVLLFNDTFYAPIFPWKPIFDRMRKQKEIDFWGLSRYHQNKSGEGRINYPSHLQSYFLVCRKKLILSRSFWEFWNILAYPLSRKEATEDFEIRFTTFFAQEKFTYMAYTDIYDKQIFDHCIGSLYVSYACELLSELQFPVIKRKALTITNFNNARRALDYIKKNTDYNEEVIYAHLQRLVRENRIGAFNPARLETFYDAHNRIYIFGHGKIGENVASYFKYRGWRYEGFIVSEKVKEESDVYEYKNIQFKKHDGIVLALGQKALNEVYSKVRKNFDRCHIFLP